MSALAHLAALAHAGTGGVDDTGQLVFTIMLVSVLVLVWVVLGVVCWIFWRAKKRDDAANRKAPDWQSAHSS
ncbi:MAG: hypothetical protein KY396_07185 [Actinobacteria bacterium]|nr:hypothetical protein [Actinomycetota bacterium]